MDLMSEVFVETVFLPSLFFFSGRLVFLHRYLKTFLDVETNFHH